MNCSVKRYLLSVVSALCVAPTSVEQVAASWLELQHTLTSPIPSADERIGFSVGIAGVRLMVGAQDNHGEVYLFHRDSGAFERSILGGDSDSDQFGLALAPYGEHVLIGAPSSDQGAMNSGAAYLFDPATGKLIESFLVPSPSYRDLLGTAIVSRGSQVVIGAPGTTVNGQSDVGAVHLFEGADGAFVRTIPNPSPRRNEDFGASLAATESLVAIGAPGAVNGFGVSTGEVHIYDGVTGRPLRTVQSPSSQSDATFGDSLALLGNVLLVGAPRVDGGGAAYLFNALTGDRLLTLEYGNASTDARFGSAVTFYRNTLVVGAYADGGSVFVFDCDGDLLDRVDNPTPAFDIHFGVSLAAVGDDLLIGANGGSGAAFLYSATNVPSGDFNWDGVVDAADYTVWRDCLGVTSNAEDYRLWRDAYQGNREEATPTTVPEPALLGLAALLGMLRRIRRDEE